MPKDIDFCYLLVYFPIDKNLEPIALQWFQRFLGIYMISAYKRNNKAQKSVVGPSAEQRKREYYRDYLFDI